MTRSNSPCGRDWCGRVVNKGTLNPAGFTTVKTWLEDLDNAKDFPNIASEFFGLSLMSCQEQEPNQNPKCDIRLRGPGGRKSLCFGSYLSRYLGL